MKTDVKDHELTRLFHDAAAEAALAGPGPERILTLARRRRTARQASVAAVALLAVALPLVASQGGDEGAATRVDVADVEAGERHDAADAVAEGSSEPGPDRPGLGGIGSTVLTEVFEHVPGREPGSNPEPPLTVQPGIPFERLFSDPADDVRACQPTSPVLADQPMAPPQCGATVKAIDMLGVSAALSDGGIYLRTTFQDLTEDPQSHPEYRDRIVDRAYTRLIFFDDSKRRADGTVGFSVEIVRQLGPDLDPDNTVWANIGRVVRDPHDAGYRQLMYDNRVPVAVDEATGEITIFASAEVVADSEIDPQMAWAGASRTADSYITFTGPGVHGLEDDRDEASA